MIPNPSESGIYPLDEEHEQINSIPQYLDIETSEPAQMGKTMADTLEGLASSYRRASLFINERETQGAPNDQNDDLFGSDMGDEETGSAAVVSTIFDSQIELVDENEPLIPKYGLKKSTFGQSCFNASNILMGIGLLSLPFAFKLTGWVVGCLLLILFAVITLHTAKLLAKCLDYEGAIQSNSYGDIGEVAFGPSGRLFISLTFFFELFAACVALVILAADSMVALFPSLDLTIVKCVVVAFVVPASISRSLSYASYGSFVGIIAMVNLLVIVLYDGFTTVESPGSLLIPVETSLYPPSWYAVPFSFGLIMAGFCGHSVFPNIYRDMKSPQNYNKVVDYSFLITVSLYFVIATSGYLMFGQFTMEEISQNLPLVASYNPFLTKVTVLLVALNPITKYPLAVAPVNQQLGILF